MTDPDARILGVIEVSCPGPHAEENVLVWDLLPCPHCGATSTDMPADLGWMARDWLHAPEIH